MILILLCTRFMRQEEHYKEELVIMGLHSASIKILFQHYCYKRISVNYSLKFYWKVVETWKFTEYNKIIKTYLKVS